MGLWGNEAADGSTWAATSRGPLYQPLHASFQLSRANSVMLHHQRLGCRTLAGCRTDFKAGNVFTTTPKPTDHLATTCWCASQWRDSGRIHQGHPCYWTGTGWLSAVNWGDTNCLTPQWSQLLHPPWMAPNDMLRPSSWGPYVRNTSSSRLEAHSSFFDMQILMHIDK